MPRNSGIKTGVKRMASAVFARVGGSEHNCEKSWKYGKDLSACFVNLEKAYRYYWFFESVEINFGRFCRSVALMVSCYAPLPLSHSTFNWKSMVCVQVDGQQSKPFHMDVGLLEGCVLSPLLFIVLHGLDQQIQPSWWLDKCSTLYDWK